jgi:chemotaxis protein CheD
MGELAVSGAAKDVLTTIGLGSCVGLVLLDSSRSTAGLAHVVYPHSTPDTRSGGQPAKYADTVVPALVGAMGRLGSLRGALEAVLVGGARMFAFVRAPELDIGSANVDAVARALAQAEIPIRISLTGGSIGRSVRVRAAGGLIAIREAGTANRVYSTAGGLLEEVASG